MNHKDIVFADALLKILRDAPAEVDLVPLFKERGPLIDSGTGYVDRIMHYLEEYGFTKHLPGARQMGYLYYQSETEYRGQLYVPLITVEGLHAHAIGIAAAIEQRIVREDSTFEANKATVRGMRWNRTSVIINSILTAISISVAVLTFYWTFIPQR